MVDYTVPDVIHDMVDLYIKHRTPFVMGTTGGNRAQILADVQAADLYAVIAPQMGKQVRRGGQRKRERERDGCWACCQLHTSRHGTCACMWPPPVAMCSYACRPLAGGSVVRAVQASRQSGCWEGQKVACAYVYTHMHTLGMRCCPLLLCVQVVAFQAMMEVMAEKFPGAFSGYTLKVCGWEPHAPPRQPQLHRRQQHTRSAS